MNRTTGGRHHIDQTDAQDGVERRRQIKQAQSRDLATIGCQEQVVVDLQHRSLSTVKLMVG